MYLLVFCLFPEYVGVGGAELLFIEVFAEFFASLFNFFVDFLFNLCEMVFNEHVCAVTLL